MKTLFIILFAIIAYILWRIYRQRDKERIEKFLKQEAEREQKLKENYPHLYGKLEGPWLEVFVGDAERGTPLLKMAFILYLGELKKIDLSEGQLKWHTLWDLTEELLEHLEKYHRGSIVEHEIAVCTYWQIAAEAVGELLKENPKIEGSKLEVEPYTNITKIVSLFPKKANHPNKEISFYDEIGSFPKESKGSAHIQVKLNKLGLLDSSLTRDLMKWSSSDLI